MRSSAVFRDARPRRLQEAIETTRSTLGVMRSRRHDSEPHWLSEAENSLRTAEGALRDGDIDRGWGLVHCARELEVFGYDEAQITAEATSMRAELASAKFAEWRREAMRQQLDAVLAWNVRTKNWSLKTHERRVRLASAFRTRHESYSTEYLNAHLLRRYQSILLTIAVLILAFALTGSAFANPESDSGIDKWWLILGAALSGALGGIASALHRTMRRSGARTPERVGSLVQSFSRPVIGAIAGVTVLLAVRAGITQTNSTTEQQVAYVLLLAFGAGFSERLVVRDPRDEAQEAQQGSTPAAPSATGRIPSGTPEAEAVRAMAQEVVAYLISDDAGANATIELDDPSERGLNEQRDASESRGPMR